jgi:hypothetical protein
MNRRLLLLALGIQVPRCGFAADAPRYGIKEDRPRAGSAIREWAVGPIETPINLRYSELNAEQRSRWNRVYEHMGPGDEPPFPVNGLRAILDPLRKAQAKLLADGDLFLIAAVDQNGAATEVRALGSPSPQLTQVAAQILLLTRFKPALCDGSPCRMEFPLKLHFETRW